MEQIQCPNCKSYNTQTMKSITGCLGMSFFAIFLPLWCAIIIAYNFSDYGYSGKVVANGFTGLMIGYALAKRKKLKNNDDCQCNDCQLAFRKD